MILSTTKNVNLILPNGMFGRAHKRIRSAGKLPSYIHLRDVKY